MNPPPQFLICVCRRIGMAHYWLSQRNLFGPLSSGKRFDQIRKEGERSRCPRAEQERPPRSSWASLGRWGGKSRAGPELAFLGLEIQSSP